MIDPGPDWTEITTAVSTGAATLIVGVTALYASRQLKDARRTRHSQLILALDEQWKTLGPSLKLCWKYPRDELARLIERPRRPGQTPLPSDLADYEGLREAVNLAETIGVLRADGALTTEVIYRTWGGTIYALWLSWETGLPKLRDYLGEPDTLRGFEAVARDILEIMEERAPGRRQPRGGATEAAPASQVAAGAELETNAGKPSFLPSSLAHDVATKSVMRRVALVFFTVLALSALRRTVRRRL